MVDRPQHLALGQRTCGCGDAARCCGHLIPMLPKLPSRPNLLPAGLQPSPGAVAEAEARGLLLTASQQAALRRVERRRSKFRRQLRRGPAILTSEPMGSRRGGGLVTGVSKGFGLNAVHAFDCDGGGYTKIGQVDSQAADWVDLGASIVRPLGQTDLLWSALPDPDAVAAFDAAYPDYALTGSRGGVGVPYDATVSGGMPLSGYPDDSVLDMIILTDANVARFAELLGLLASRQLKAVLTFMTLGGGGDFYDGSPAVAYDDEGKKLLIKAGSTMLWAATHIGQSADGNPFIYRVDDEGGDVWNTAVLNPDSPYQRKYLAQIGSRAITLLVRAMGVVRESYPHLVLGDIVTGIEIFNEVGICNWYQEVGDDPVARADLGGADWGQAWFDVAQAMWQAFDDKDSVEDRVPFLLPGIESWLYFEDDAGSSDFPRTWEYKKDFLGAMLAQVQLMLGSWADAPEGGLQELVGGVDLHWYHKQVPGLETSDTDPVTFEVMRQAGYVHIGYLFFELAELREQIDGGDYQLSDASISVLETGMSTSLVHYNYKSSTLDDKDLRLTIIDFIPTTFRDDETRWQSLEVWRRLGTGVASVADAVGWHAWMSADSANFQGMGLRTDAVQVGEATHSDQEIWAPTPSTEDTNDSTTRPAWYAYQRLTQELGGLLRSSTLVWPPVDSRAALRDLLAEDLPSDSYAVVVLEFERVFASQHVYLVFVEPVFLAEDAEPESMVSGTVRIRAHATRTGLGSHVQSVDTLPDLDPSVVVLDLGFSSCRDLPERLFPSTAAEPQPFDDDRTIFTGSSVFGWTMSFDTSTLDGLAPKLLLSDRKLEWSPPIF